MTVRVLVTRATEDAAALAPGLARLGFEPVLVPLVERHWDVEAVIAVAEAHPVVDVVFVTSGPTAQILATAAPNAWRTARWAAVGPATAGRLQALGLPCHLVAERATAADLVAALGDVQGKVILYPKADLAEPATVEQLTAAGATVHEVVAYRNRAPEGAVERLLGSLPVAATLLLSGSAAERLADAVPPARRGELGDIVVIGPSTARVCERVGLRVANVAEPHTAGGVVQALSARWLSP